MPSLNSPLKIAGVSDLKEYLKQYGISVSEEKVRVRVNPESLENLDHDIPVPDMLIDALAISNENGEKAAVFTYLGDQSLRSFVIPVEFLEKGSKPSEHRMNSSTDLFGALNISDGYERSLEHREAKEILRKEEFDRGSVDVFKIKVSQDHNFGGFSPVNTSEVEAKRVVHNQKVMFMVDNEWDNYVRPDLVSEGYLESEPVFVRSTTPQADAAKERKEEAARRAAISENQRLMLEESRKRREIKEKQKAISTREMLSKLFNELSVELFNNKLESPEGKNVSLRSLISLADRIQKIEKITGKKPLLSVDPKDSPQAMLNSLHEQSSLEFFRAKNGFYIKAYKDDESGKYVTQLFDTNDALLSTINAGDESISLEPVKFHFEYDYITENIEVMRANDCDVEVIELGKHIEYEVKFEEFFSFVTSLGFAEEGEDLPPLDIAENIHDLNEFSGSYLMDVLAHDNETVKGIKKEIDDFMESLPSNRRDLESDSGMAM